MDQHQERASYSTRSMTESEPIVHNIFENKTGSWQYIVADPSTNAAAIIDPVLDYDPISGTISTKTADSLLSMVKRNGYKVDMILETHAHADHLTAASYLKHRLVKEQGDLDTPIICIGKRINEIQKTWGERYNIPVAEYQGVFDKLFDDDETFHVGNMSAKAIHLPGHTPDLMGYKIRDCVFVGDSVFNADLGSARADFPGGSAEDLFRSGRKLLSLPNDVKIYTGHDYPPEGREAPLPYMSVRDHRGKNKHLKDGTSEKDFVKLRRERDVTLAEPKLLHQSLQMNIRAGRLPAPTDTGLRMLHIPLKMKEAQW
ncbi:hypothetical protein LTR70_010420 [Exophiala xenobiotica]|uniref:Metallo-beta-lactamase domain-containing protein n=1 Tax=Lithohypha guttulata TaxID=1690604 RepID=A0ABR0JU21_9EURO|nr:hypothetical protein LTR24_010390 [Lithohypha guttulata]KAK5309292.1 hypothetical protein LTR70_010420 [Exophiala xenobiotica]